jgi:hypothetical protein
LSERLRPLAAQSILATTKNTKAESEGRPRIDAKRRV